MATKAKSKVLHLGAGRNLDRRFNNKEDVLYVINDIEPLETVNWAFDLDQYPWPLPDEFFNTIIAIDVLEHLADTKKAIEECWRVLSSDGVVEIQVPFFGSLAHATDMTHRRGFTSNSFGFFMPGHAYCESQPWYTKARFRCLEYSLDGTSYPPFVVPDDWRQAMLTHKTVGNIQISLIKIGTVK